MTSERGGPRLSEELASYLISVDAIRPFLDNLTDHPGSTRSITTIDTFLWRDTKEGHVYWEDLRSGEPEVPRSPDEEMPYIRLIPKYREGLAGGFQGWRLPSIVTHPEELVVEWEESQLI